MLLDNFIRLSCLSLTVYKLMRCLKAMPHDFLIVLALQRRVRLTLLCRLSALWLTDSFHAEAPLGGELGVRVGVGTLNKLLYGEFIPPVQPLTILYTISDRMVPLSYTVEHPLTATSPFFGAQSVHWRFFKPFSNSHLSTTTTFRLSKGGGYEELRFNCIFHWRIIYIIYRNVFGG